ncbi:hypothetical protein SLOPH_1760 [Spraguea lophii 42_110]|uniref:Uncharacterized protein n=1 Tax=Spraguea lophii (strain 42_110) TaxID=1358809 RepID=S7WAC7_SPRLO|nr:hypothetical protein SLOPH_1760 [Spraguea lophii 42_110]
MNEKDSTGGSPSKKGVNENNIKERKISESFNDEKKKRVSFANDNEIKYLYHDDLKSKTDSSIESLKECNVDYTFDFKDVIGLGKQVNNEDNQKENLHDLVNLNINNGRRDSLYEEVDDKNNDNIRKKESIENKEDHQNNIINLADGSKENELNNTDLKRVSLELNTTLNMDVTQVEMEDMINTVDLKKQIKSFKKETLDNFLNTYNIRFLDTMLTAQTRRDTLSKSKNDVDLRLIEYYDTFLMQRIEFYLNLAEDVKTKMIELEAYIKGKESVTSTEKIKNNVDFETRLKRLKMTSRQLAKIQWQNFIANKEQEFNTKLLDLKNKILNETDRIRRKSEEVSKRRIEAIKKKEMILKKIEEIKSRSSKYSQPELSKIDKLNKIHEEQLAHIKSLQEELEIKEEEDVKIINRKNKLKIEKAELEADILRLKDLIKEKSTTEDSLLIAKDAFYNSSSILDINVNSIKPNNLSLTFLSFTFILQDENNALEIKLKEDDKILQNLLSMCDLKCDDIFEKLKRTIKYLYKIDNIRTMIKVIEEKYNTEYFYQEKELEIKIYNFIKTEIKQEIKINYENIENDKCCYQLLNLCLR